MRNRYAFRRSPLERRWLRSSTRDRDSTILEVFYPQCRVPTERHRSGVTTAGRPRVVHYTNGNANQPGTSWALAVILSALK